MREQELAEIRERAEGTTPAPWYAKFLDDDHAANLVAVSIVPDTSRGERWPGFDSGEIVAETLVQ